MGQKIPPDSPYPHYLGNQAFPNGEPVCKPIVPGRRIKPLEGPVHPGFKGKPKPPPRVAPPAFVTARSSQTDDVYKPLKKKTIGTSKNKKK